MNHGFFVLQRICFLTLLLLLMSCDLKPKLPLKVGTNIWPGYETLYLARSLDLYPENTVKLVELPSASEVIHAFKHRLLDVAALTLDEAITLAQHQNDIRIILVMDISNGGDVLLVKPEISALAEIKGKRVGVEQGAVGAVLLDGALTAANLRPTDITLIHLSINEQYAAYQDNKVDAVVTFDPVKTELQQLGAKTLFDSSQIPNRIVDILVTRQEIIARRSDDLKHLLAAYFQALDYLKNHKKDAAIRIAPRLSLDPSKVNAQFQGLIFPDLNDNINLLLGSTAKLKASANSLTTLMLEQKLLSKNVITDNLMNGSLLPKKGVQ